MLVLNIFFIIFVTALFYSYQNLVNMVRVALFATFLVAATSIYDFKVPGLEGGQIDFSKFKGKKIMIVNTASQCGNTPQYADLERLYEAYKDKLVIVGFPANNFGQQEPGSNGEIAEFCKKNYGVKFLMGEKVSVKGEDIHPLFKYLTEEAKKQGIDDPIKWNFTKFLLDENGKLITVIFHKTNPMSEEVLKYLK